MTAEPLIYKLHAPTLRRIVENSAYEISAQLRVDPELIRRILAHNFYSYLDNQEAFNHLQRLNVEGVDK